MGTYGICFFHNVHARGAHSFRVSKIRGHDADGLCHQDLARQRIAVGNSIADSVTKEARNKMFSDAICNLADYLADRFHVYVIFVTAIRSIMHELVFSCCYTAWLLSRVLDTMGPDAHCLTEPRMSEPEANRNL